MESLSPTEILAERVRGQLTGLPIVTKRMFSGLTFLLDGNMLCCVSAKGLMVRVGADQEGAALARPFAAPCLGTGRPMAGFVMVAPAGVAADADLEGWVALARAYVGALPAKAVKPARGMAARA